ncbi:hypothetical protein BGW41_003303 [Actinomortierella wolfii]|nr:hypothetical protein BGW41_003303 [Actinomortierella wolfii]
MALVGAVWTRPTTVQTVFLLKQQSNNCCCANHVKHLYPGHRVFSTQLTTALPKISRPVLLPFLHPSRAHPQPVLLRRSKSTLAAAAAASNAAVSVDLETPQRSRYSKAPQSSPVTTATIPPSTKRGPGRPRKAKSAIDQKERNIATLSHQTSTCTSTNDGTEIDLATTPPRQGSTYQEVGVTGINGAVVGLEPAPFPESVLTPLTVDLVATLDDNNNNNKKQNHSRSSLSSYSHNDLESFESIEHNNPNSSVFHGTRFEYQTQEILRKQLGIYTHRSAGHSDEGVDLRGKWFLPLSASPKPEDWVRHLNVIVQCKKMTSKVGPRFVRELQGTLSYESQPTIAILAVSSDFTKQALTPCIRSVWPMALAVIDVDRQECRKLMWNQAAERIMHGLQIGSFRSAPDAEDRPVLCFEGRVLERLPGPWRPSERMNDKKEPKSDNIEKALETVDTEKNTKTEDEPGDKYNFDRTLNYPAYTTEAVSDDPCSTDDYASSMDEWAEEALAEYELENKVDSDLGSMTEEYAEYIRTLSMVDQLLHEAESDQEYSTEDWAWVDRSGTASAMKILHPIDLSSLVQPYTQTSIINCK